MAERLEVLVVTKYEKNGESKSRFSRAGAAFPTKNGGWSLKFDGPVVIVPGVNDLVLFPPREQGQQGGNRGGGYESQGGGSDGGQEIPFAPLGNL
jgi:hypothetical protein